MTQVLSRTFSSLQSRNYRIFFAGQIVSVSGTWMQGVAQAWLVLQLTGSGTMLGLTTALQFVPMLLFGAWGGVLADRFDKRRVLLGTQTAAALLALTLGVLTATGVVVLWHVLVLAFAFGVIVALDNPTRQSFMHEMVGPDHLPNAVTLNSVVVNAARVLGPSAAGFLIASVGTAVCFLFNAGSYLAVIAALALMRPADLHRDLAAVRSTPRLREGLRYVWADRNLRVPLIVMAVVGALAYEFQIVLPLLARFTFDGDARLFGTMTGLMGAGAVVGGLATASRKAPSPRSLVGATFVFGAAILALAASPALPLTIVLLVVTGAASIVFIATVNASLQLGAVTAMRGRVMALWGVAFMGTTPVGGPIAGWVGETFGARWALAMGGVATLLAGVYALRALGVRPLGGLAQSAAVATRMAGEPAPAVPDAGPVPSTWRERLHRLDRARRRALALGRAPHGPQPRRRRRAARARR